jgi:Spy/CpxP family protein refolding chaperone
MNRTPSLAIAAAIALTAVTGAMAQQPPGRRPAPSPEMQAMREAHEKQRMADLRTVLRLRPDQEPALSAFLQAGRRPKMGDRRGPPPQGQAMTTPQRLDEMAKRDAERTAEGQRRADALRTFYAALGPDQRQVFDALMRLQGPRGMHSGRGGMRGPGGGHGRGGPPPGPPPGA